MEIAIMSRTIALVPAPIPHAVETAATKPRPLSLRPENIPAALQKLRQFVCWNYEWVKPSGGRPGRWTKPLYIATDPGCLASSTDPNTWRSFDEAVDNVIDGKFDGLGIVLASRVVAVDLDHCIDDNGVVATRDQHIVDALNSYTECSPSGDGIRVLVWSDPLPPGGRKRGDVEMYDRGRYVTLTGHHILGTPTSLQERTTELAKVHAEVFGEKTAAAIAEPVKELSDDEVLRLARTAKNSAKFIALFNGHTNGYASSSEADVALCCMLAYWTGRNVAQIDRLFRKSKLLRDKWDERHGDRTYGRRTIDTAVTKTRDVYTRTANGQRVELIRAADVTVKKLEWLWHARLAIGAITLVEGGPEKGKSTLLTDLSARVSKGQSFPGETDTREPRNVVMLVAEDDTSTTVVPRLTAAGADLNRIYFLGATKDEEGQIVPFHMSDDCDRARNARKWRQRSWSSIRWSAISAAAKDAP
jgi:putative DNA primase/helicase